jgi:hypothetical protein
MIAGIWERHNLDATIRRERAHLPDTVAFYPQRPGFTSPGHHADALARLPAGLAALTEVAHGLIVHEHLAGMYGFELAEERRASVIDHAVAVHITSVRTGSRAHHPVLRGNGCAESLLQSRRRDEPRTSLSRSGSGRRRS